MAPRTFAVPLIPGGSLGFRTQTHAGEVRIIGVETGGAAAGAGLCPGKLVGIDGVRIETEDDIGPRIESAKRSGQHFLEVSVADGADGAGYVVGELLTYEDKGGETRRARVVAVDTTTEPASYTIRFLDHPDAPERATEGSRLQRMRLSPFGGSPQQQSPASPTHDEEAKAAEMRLSADWPLDAAVMAHGLSAAAELNGAHGRVAGYVGESGRVCVRFPHGKKALKPQNLKLVGGSSARMSPTPPEHGTPQPGLPAPADFAQAMAAGAAAVSKSVSEGLQAAMQGMRLFQETGGEGVDGVGPRFPGQSVPLHTAPGQPSLGGHGYAGRRPL
eukprot:TRINITY_DN14337_c0_g1_i1.p1 TRINITY_DN14337_c0_g1~~TRINITY_DN14337_c0_g1_i1.p1  ORF type:complete len:331 (+),score=92.94 TRINITY_DN14337_c0_g1_i1:112-1104(+)